MENERAPIAPDVSGLENLLRALMHGKYSSLSLTYNDCCGNYQTVGEYVEEDESKEEGYEFISWVSPEERAKAIEENSMWVLQWYSQNPVGFYTIAAATLRTLITYMVTWHEENPEG